MILHVAYRAIRGCPDRRPCHICDTGTASKNVGSLDNFCAAVTAYCSALSKTDIDGPPTFADPEIVGKDNESVTIYIRPRLPVPGCEVELQDDVAFRRLDPFPTICRTFRKPLYLHMSSKV